MQIEEAQREIFAKYRLQIEEGTPQMRICQQQVEPVLVAQLVSTFEVLETFDVAEQPFATFRANDRCKQHCVRRA